MAITYDQRRPEINDIIAIYQSSGIKRPVQDANRIRALTDFSYCCYLSDLAVRAEYQHQGIGKRLIGEVKQAVGEQHAAPTLRTRRYGLLPENRHGDRVQRLYD